MHGASSYCKRRLKWATSATRSQLRERSLLVDIVAIPVVGYALLKSIEHVRQSTPASLSLFEWLTSTPEAGAWSLLYTIPSAIVILLVHLSINWMLAPGKMDRSVRENYEAELQRVADNARHVEEQRKAEINDLRSEKRHLRRQIEHFERLLRPNIWIAAKVYGDSPISDRGSNVGFTLENKSASDIRSAEVSLISVEYGFPDEYRQGRSNFISNDDMGYITKFPIILEWSPDEQGKTGVAFATIPAGTTRLVGLFSDQVILSASHEIRRHLPVSLSFVYRVTLQFSAEGVPAITLEDYVISRISRSEALVPSSEVPYVVEPDEPVELIGPMWDARNS